MGAYACAASRPAPQAVRRRLTQQRPHQVLCRPKPRSNKSLLCSRLRPQCAMQHSFDKCTSVSQLLTRTCPSNVAAITSHAHPTHSSRVPLPQYDQLHSHGCGCGRSKCVSLQSKTRCYRDNVFSNVHTLVSKILCYLPQTSVRPYPCHTIELLESNFAMNSVTFS